LLATEKYNSSEPVNLGSGLEISIKELVNKVVEMTGFKGDVRWDSTKPDGQPRRCLDVSLAKELFDFSAEITFDEGLKNVIDWYLEQK